MEKPPTSPPNPFARATNAITTNPGASHAPAGGLGAQSAKAESDGKTAAAEGSQSGDSAPAKPSPFKTKPNTDMEQSDPNRIPVTVSLTDKKN